MRRTDATSGVTSRAWLRSCRLRIVELLSNFLRSALVLTPDDFLLCVYLCLNRLAPAYEGIELGIGDQLLMKAIVHTTGACATSLQRRSKHGVVCSHVGRSMEKVKADLQSKGDLGLVAEASRSTQRTMFAPPKLNVRGVFAKLKEIASMAGNSVKIPLICSTVCLIFTLFSNVVFEVQ